MSMALPLKCLPSISSFHPHYSWMVKVTLQTRRLRHRGALDGARSTAGQGEWWFPWFVRTILSRSAARWPFSRNSMVEPSGS